MVGTKVKDTPQKNGATSMEVVPVEHAEKAKERAVRYLDALGLPELDEAHKYIFIDICASLGLNPFIREIYGVPFTDKDTGRKCLTIMVGYEVYLKRAQRSGLLKGWKVWTEGTGSNLKACVEIHRKDWEFPFHHEVMWSEYAQYRYDRDQRKWVLTRFWKEKPYTMLKKVVIAQGFRLCFPEDVGELPYTGDELPLDGAIVENQLTEGVESEGLPEVAIRKELERPEPEEGLPTGAPEQNGGPPPPSPGPEGVTPPSEGKSVDEMFKTMVERWKEKGISADVWRFLVAKNWIRDDQSVDDLSDNQVTRLYNNYNDLMGLFDKWLKDHPGKTGAPADGKD